MGYPRHRRSAVRRHFRKTSGTTGRNVAFGLTGVVVLAAALVAHAIITTPEGSSAADRLRSTPDPSASMTPGGSAVASGAASPASQSVSPVPSGDPKILFGIGTEADTARDTPLVKQAPVKMLTSWYNGPNDLSWMTGWRTGTVRTSFAAGYAMHIVVLTNDAEATLGTARGSACGRGYPLSSRFVDDINGWPRHSPARRTDLPCT